MMCPAKAKNSIRGLLLKMQRSPFQYLIKKIAAKFANINYNKRKCFIVLEGVAEGNAYSVYPQEDGFESLQ